MPMFVHNFTSYFHEKQRDLYFVTFSQVKKGPLGLPDVQDYEAIPGRRELLKWIKENLPETKVGPIFAYDSDSGFITMPYDGSIFLEFAPEDQKKFESRWETPEGKTRRPHSGS